MSIKVGICGAGAFAEAFIPLFQAHPGVDEVSIAEHVPERRLSAAQRFQIDRTFPSFDDLVDSDVDAIAIFTQHHFHGPQAIRALRAGKHVYSAVPMATSLEEIREIVDLADRDAPVYMMGETSYYYPTALLCRERFERGEFGEFVYGEGEYLHDMSQGLYEVYRRRHGESWRSMASIPPMFYPTHSFSLVLSAMNVEITRVCCLGYVDRDADGIFSKSVSQWGNEFSNETALCSTSNGGVVRINEMRRVGAPSAERMRLSGTEATFEEGGLRAFWMTRSGTVEDLTALVTCAAPATAATGGGPTGPHRPAMGFAPVHPAGRLPAEFAGLPNDHYGSHQFLVDDFVQACLGERQPTVSARVAASYCAPGLVAHESSQLGGQPLDVPSFLAAPTEPKGA